MTELKPCPFCGGKAKTFRMAFELCWDVVCTDNTCPNTTLYNSRSAAITAWNRRADGWISVSERLPEEGQEVLVYVQDDDLFWLVGFYDQKWIENVGILEEHEVDNVSHWKPILPPQKH